MSAFNLHSNQYNVTDIQRYLQGKMNAAEMHAIEKAALDDPFLADAIEGFQVTEKDHDDDVVAGNLDILRQQLADRALAGKVVTHSKFRWWYAAAAAIVLLIVSVFVINNSNISPDTNELAQTNEKKADSIPQETAPSVAAAPQYDSINAASNYSTDVVDNKKDSETAFAKSPASVTRSKPFAAAADNTRDFIAAPDSAVFDRDVAGKPIAKEDLTKQSNVQKDVVAQDLKLQESKRRETDDFEGPGGKEKAASNTYSKNGQG